ncbi:MAG: ABC transporter permease [Planctomycetota bacterium]|jgi:phospholipid/cholesterol/gamma-HCH transport system permease protein
MPLWSGYGFKGFAQYTMIGTAKKNTEGSVTAESLKNGGLKLIFKGRLDSRTTGRIWQKAEKYVRHNKPAMLIIDVAQLNYCDTIGVGLFIWLKKIQLKNNAEFAIENLPEHFKKLMDLLAPEHFEPIKPAPRSLINFIGDIGKYTATLLRDIYIQICFVGELAAAFISVMIHPQRMRWKDAFLAAEAAGANAIGIVSLIGFLFGLILAFQSAIPMREFGAELYVADLVALSLLRVMGPFLAAIILTARSGSAFAAEIGTMKVNEEIDALTTMGLDPVRFLAVPRVWAGMIVTPLLAVFTSLFGLIGGCVVMLSLGFPLVTYINEVQLTVDHVDLLIGLAKAVVFGILIASVGCLRGLQTQSGSRAVGEAATRAVVSGIVLIVLAEGVFAVILYFLEI